MSNYYGVNAIEKKGELVYVSSDRKPHTGGEALIIILDNGLYEIAVDVTSDQDYKYFYNQYAIGMFIRYKIYRIAKSELVNCPDEGRRYKNFNGGV